ncbi:ATP-binding protein [Desulfovibrio cuneatus]|uniref:ATP-binding protein n=1 Tax=Desulfovibrio cuneatus TaxID=159728 RepID=UPI0004296AB7|nr:ATP-binding protein [Desulfovibrio cuneatus]
MNETYTAVAMLNTEALVAELDWFGRMLGNCLLSLGLQEGEKADESVPDLPQGAWYTEFVQHYQLSGADRLVLILALLPHIKPETLSSLLQEEACKKYFGGVHGRQFNGLIPTMQTALVLLSGSNLLYRLAGMEFFAEDSRLISRGILRLGPCPPDEPRTCAALLVDEGALSSICRGKAYEPSGQNFPAHKLTTPLEWDDLILPAVVLRQVQDILDWAVQRGGLYTKLGLGKHLRPGYKALFYGPPGTGKTLTAALIGKQTGLPVYRVDLSQIVSKYIGETEKNLEHLFRMAENKEWIIFFDEADALFNKRTNVEDAHDRHANQETAYLLQRLENYPNLVIMATNMQDNIDAAFSRRFNCGIFFPLPGKTERLRLWDACLGEKLHLHEDARATLPNFELSGGQIANIALRLGLWALKSGSMTISAETLKRGIMLENVLQGKA